MSLGVSLHAIAGTDSGALCHSNTLKGTYSFNAELFIDKESSAKPLIGMISFDGEGHGYAQFYYAGEGFKYAKNTYTISNKCHGVVQYEGSNGARAFDYFLSPDGDNAQFAQKEPITQKAVGLVKRISKQQILNANNYKSP